MPTDHRSPETGPRKLALAVFFFVFIPIAIYWGWYTDRMWAGIPVAILNAIAGIQVLRKPPADSTT
jgi:hypothetical protein